ncbi:hypothetical protein PENTCL1PPCAC_18968 [Pristionchus entomophagus]|uniref:Mrpl-55 n=1 Tax=Pristionchus entomophagus TaxID=358040 RepID=A0AAV5TQP8_9BILA|nr:hypothetical protein PENTCL1PPCAC_18968 [Pristionchus entomophagus]
MASTPCLRGIARIAGYSTTVVRGNAYRSTLGGAARHEYLRKYPLNLVRPDGSMIGIRASEPVNYLAMPIDLKQLSEDERLQMLAARKPKAKKIVKESIDDNFNAGAYMSSFWSGETTPSSSPQMEATSVEEKTKTTSIDEKKKGEKKDKKKK